MDKKYITLDDISAHKKALELSNYIWNIVIKWDYLAQKTIGAQFIDAADSISANIAEGFYRFFKKEKIKFYYYSLGSAGECLDWTEKAKTRSLLKILDYERILKELKEMPKEIHSLIKYTNLKLKQ